MGCFGKILTETKLNFCTLKASLDYCVPCGVLYHVEYAYHLRWQLYYMLFIVVVIWFTLYQCLQLYVIKCQQCQ